jgi:hypothetical protein
MHKLKIIKLHCYHDDNGYSGRILETLHGDLNRIYKMRNQGYKKTLAWILTAALLNMLLVATNGGMASANQDKCMHSSAIESFIPGTPLRLVESGDGLVPPPPK